MTYWLDTSTYSGVGGDSTSQYYGEATVDVYDTATYTRISGGSGVHYKNWAYYGIATELQVNNVTQVSWEGYPTSATNSFQLLSASEKFYSVNITKTHSAQTIPVKMRAYGKAVSGVSSSAGGDVSATYNVTVPALASYTVAYNANGGTGAPASQTKWYGETLTLSNTTPTRTNYTFAGWATSNGGAVAYQAGGSYTSNSAVTLYAVWTVNAPTTAPTIGTNTRNSDTQNTIAWTWSGTDVIDGFIIERSANGGAYSQIGTASAGATSYVDASTAANSYYSYKVKAYNSSGASSASSASNTTYNTPSACTGLTAVFNSSNYVVLNWTNPGLTETMTEVYSSSDGLTYSVAAIISGADQTSYTDTNPPAGDAYYKVANCYVYGGTTLRSGFSNTVQVETLAQPNPPSWVSPANNAVFDMPASITLSWVHNTVDGTAQTSAVVDVSTNGGSTWTSTTLTQSSTTYSLNTSSYANGTDVQVRIKTKGTYANYSDWGAARTFKVRQAPSVSITDPVPTDGGTISDVPVIAGFTYTDNSGSFQSASIRVTDSNGITLYSGTPTWTVAGSSYTFSIPVADLLPVNNASYTLTVTANSTSGLSVTAARVFATNYSEPNPPAVTYEIDPANASVTVNVAEGTGGSLIATVAVGLFRIDASGEQAISAVMESGASVTDYLPPLDQEFTYRAVAYTSNGLTSQTLVQVTVDSGGACFFNWGNQNAECATFVMDAAWSVDNSPKRALYEVVGLTDPVLRTTSRRTRTLKASGTVWWGSESQLEALQSEHGRVWFREPRGHVTPVAATVGLTYPKGSPTVNVSVSMTQVSEA